MFSIEQLIFGNRHLGKSVLFLVGIISFSFFTLTVYLWSLVVKEIKLIPDKGVEVTVVGEGEIKVKPEIVRIEAIIVSQNKNLIKAQNENQNITQSVFDYLESLGLNENNFKTSFYNIEPVYSYQEGRGSQINSFRVRHGLMIEVSDLSLINKILDELVDLGVNQITQVSFDVKDKDLYQEQARKEAVQKAEEKITKIAQNLGLKVKKIVRYSEEAPGIIPIPLSLERSVVSSPVVQPGLTEIKSKVSITYELK